MVERVAHDSGVDFISIKAQPGGESQLVLNPRVFPRVNEYLKGYGGSRVSRRYLKHICKQCEGCSPTIVEDGEGFRINRKGYSFDETRKPLFVAKKLQAESVGTHTRRVYIVDDQYTQIMAEALAWDHHVLMVHVNSYVDPDFAKLRALRGTIESFRPDVVVADKGLGLIDGIDLIQSVRDMGIRTIMYTGEIQTAETKKVADWFVVKPDLAQVEAIIASL